MNPTRFDRLATRLAARLSRRSALASGTALASLTALGLRARAQQPSPAASPAAGATTLADTAADFLFVQVASDATWTPKDGQEGVYTLTLTHQDGQTIFFSDRPERIVGAAPTQNVLDSLGFTPADPPNAAIVAGEEILVVELTNPVYDATAGTLTYDAIPIDPGTAADGIQYLAQQQTDQDLPEDLGPTSLFIDSAQETCSEYINCWYVGNAGPGCSPIIGKDGWLCPAGTIPNGPIDACWDWGEFSCDPCDGSGKDPLRDACNNAYGVCNGRCDVYVGE